jgi:hypothetical protein
MNDSDSMASRPRTVLTNMLLHRVSFSLQFQLAMQESLMSAVVCIVLYSTVSNFVVGETRGNNVTYIGKSSNFSNANSW